MTIQEWGAIGEVIGGVAVVASLLYLGLQVRQSTQQARVRATNEALSNILHAFDPCYLAGNVEIFATGLERYGELSGSELTIFRTMLYRGIHQFERIFSQHQVGALDEDTYQTAIRSLRDFQMMPGFRHWWGENKELFGEAFQRLYDRVDPQGAGAPSPSA